ncbi:MAG: hypothetical protein U9N35_00125 [Euryarchaeota archaeon]|nr:hypothetical protein [Euryarchaeota archaeon]
MPEGFTIEVELNGFLARSHENYTSKVTIKTSSELPQGKYVLFFNVYFENGIERGEWITINVGS